MGAFPGFLLRKADTPAAGIHRAINEWRLAALAMSYPASNPRALQVGWSGGGSTFPAWNPASTYTLGDAEDSITDGNVVEHDGKQWVLHTTQAPTATFPGTANWDELKPLPFFRTIWGDVTKTESATNSKAILNALVAAGFPLRFHAYVYMPGADKTGETGGLPTATWLDTNDGWLYCDGETLVTTTKTTASTTTSSSTIELSDTTGLTVGMSVWGTGIAETNEAFVTAILSGPPRITVGTDKTTSGVTALNVTIASGATLNFSNQQWEFRDFDTSAVASAKSLCVSPAIVTRRLDSNGDHWAQWMGKQLRTDSTYTGWPIYGLNLDNVIPMEGYATGSGDQITDAYEASFPTYSTGHHRLGVRERCTESAAKAAIYQGWLDVCAGLRKAGWRIWGNGGTKRPAVWHGMTDSTLMEGSGSFYSPESGHGQAGWRQNYANAKSHCEGESRSRVAPVVWHWKSYDDDGGGTAGRPVTQPWHRDMMFGLCSTLLTDSGLFAYTREAATDYPVEVRDRFYLAEMDARIGVPVGSMPSVAGDGSGFWVREYTNGLVVVRPKGTGNATWATAGDADYTLPFDVVELTGTLNPEDQGRTRLAGTTVAFPPRSARIFLRA